MTKLLPICFDPVDLARRPLAWTAPKPEELPGQLETVRRAFQLLYGHSDADVYFHPWMFSKQGLRQTMNHPVYKVRLHSALVHPEKSRFEFWFLIFHYY